MWRLTRFTPAPSRWPPPPPPPPPPGAARTKSVVTRAAIIRHRDATGSRRRESPMDERPLLPSVLLPPPPSSDAPRRSARANSSTALRPSKRRWDQLQRGREAAGEGRICTSRCAAGRPPGRRWPRARAQVSRACASANAFSSNNFPPSWPSFVLLRIFRRHWSALSCRPIVPVLTTPARVDRDSECVWNFGQQKTSLSNNQGDITFDTERQFQGTIEVFLSDILNLLSSSRNSIPSTQYIKYISAQ